MHRIQKSLSVLALTTLFAGAAFAQGETPSTGQDTNRPPGNSGTESAPAKVKKHADANDQTMADEKAMKKAKSKHHKRAHTDATPGPGASKSDDQTNR